MELDRIGVCELEVRQFEPLAGLNRILANTNKSHDALRVETSGIADGLQEDTVEFINLSAMLSGGALYKHQPGTCKETQ